MAVLGIIIHHSACSSINGKGFDYLITKQGAVIPAQEQTDPQYLHLCVEGDFSEDAKGESSSEQLLQEQLFVLEKMILRLSMIYNLSLDSVYSHHPSCPGEKFPWSKLVILPHDRYH